MSSVNSIPADPALPQMQSLLDAELMRGVLARSLAPGQPEPAVRIGYLRYRPGRSLLVGYEVRLRETEHDAFAVANVGADLAARAAAPDSAALVAKLAGRTPAHTPLAYVRELDALIQWLPLDLALPAMAEPPEVLRDRIIAAGVELDPDDLPRPVKHKPTTRGVLRLNEHFVKAYPNQESFAESVRALEASASLPFPTARCTAVVPDLLIAAQSRLPGERPGDPAEVAGDAGRLLAELHATPAGDLPLEPPKNQLKKAAKQASLVATIVPGLAPRMEELMRRFEAAVPNGDLVTSHGGFHISQVLRSDGEIAVVDFDGMCLAPAALDVSSYVASLVEGPDDLRRAAETLDVLADAYGRRPPGVHWYLATHLLGRARRPFTRLRPGWPDEVAERVAAAEAALEL